jgi:CheY-like chemotaxis protein
MDGEQALALLRANTDYDVLILDVNMPGLSGWEVLRLLRDDPEHAQPNLPVVVLSASNVLGTPLAEAYDVALILAKPVSAPDLVRAIASVLRR